VAALIRERFAMERSLQRIRSRRLGAAIVISTSVSVLSVVPLLLN
jgi:hypothetical protein